MAKTNDKWDVIIKPKRGLFEIDLKEVWRYRDLILLFVKRDFITVYKQTILGPIWHLAQPLMMTLTYSIIFTEVADLKNDDIQPLLFYMSGIIIWNYFSNCLVKTSDTFIANSAVFGKVYFPRLAVPCSIVISNLITFVLQLAFFICFYIFFAVRGTADPSQLGWNLLLIPYMVLITAMLGLGMGIIVSSLTTKYRDFKFLIQFGIQLLMYASPVIYSLSTISASPLPPAISQYLIYNPLSSILEGFRFVLFGQGFFLEHDLMAFLGYSSITTVVILFIGIVMFNRVEKSFMDTV